MSAYPGTPTAQTKAHAELLDHLAGLTAAGRRIPCTAGDPHDWDNPTDLQATRRAVAACQDCPALAACRDYALTHREPAGVWGAMTAKQRESAHRSADEIRSALVAYTAEKAAR